MMLKIAHIINFAICAGAVFTGNSNLWFVLGGLCSFVWITFYWD